MEDTPNICICLQSKPIDETHFMTQQNVDSGAFISFLGKTRHEHHKDHGVLAGLHYTAHTELAEETLRSIAKNAVSEYRCHQVTICHRLGMVPVGESSVAVAVSAQHRASALKATEEIMNELKAKVPIWKEKHWTSGKTWSEGTPIT